MSNNLKAHYDETFSENNGELYEPLSGLDLIAHNRRMELLDAIELPNLSDAVVVDYGVGSWGFGCIYPRLKECRHAIGFDIAEAALSKSAEVSAKDPALRGKTVDYYVSLGYSMDLPDNFVDVFFCGECIEHVEDTNAFLAEVYRVLKPGALAIFTTPNGDPWAYRQLKIRWCVGFEHVALMDFEEFRGYLEAFFEPVEYIGFNQSLLPDLDKIVPQEVGELWVVTCRNDPQDATSLIGVVRKSTSSKLPASSVEIVDWTQARVGGAEPERLDLLGSVQGAMIWPGSSFWIDVPEGMTRANIIFWSHPWSGHARVRYKDDEQIANLYSHAGGCYRVVLRGLDGGCLLLEPTGDRDPRSNANQLILYRVVFAKGPEGAESDIAA
jgi:SAM-dependent methyltransferase